MTTQELSNELGAVKTVEEFYGIFGKLMNWPEQEVFEILFTIATDYKSHPWPAYAFAADMLIALDPRCPLTCRDALIRLGRGHLEPGLQTLPFYLVTQFGKHHVHQEAANLLAQPELDEATRQPVSLVHYWSKYPVADLATVYFARWKPMDRA